MTNHESRAMQALDQREDILAAAAKAKRQLTDNEERQVASLEAVAKGHLDTHTRQMDAQRAPHAAIIRGKHGGGQFAPEGRTGWLPGLHEYRELQHEARAIGTTGAFIPTLGASQYFDLMRPRVSLLAAGPVVLPVEGYGAVKVPRVTSSVTVGATPENSPIAVSDPGLGELLLDPIKIAAYTLVAREALEDSAPALRDVVARALVSDAAVALDKQFLTGNGVGGNMLGLRNVTGYTPGPSTGANGSSLTFSLLSDALAAAEQANTDPEHLAWFMAPRVFNSYRKLLDSQNRPIVSLDVSAGAKPSILGVPVHVSNNLPVNETQGTSTDCSSILLADMSQVVVAQARQVELSMSEHVGFASDQIAVRVTARYAIGVPQSLALTILSGVRP